MPHASRPRRTGRVLNGTAALAVASLAFATLPGASAVPGSDTHPAVPVPAASATKLNSVSRLQGATGKVSSRLVLRKALKKEGRAAVFVQFSGLGAATTAARRGGSDGAALSRRDAIGRTADSVLRTARGADAKVQELFQVSNALPGVGLLVDGDAIDAIARRADVVKVTPLVPKKATNASAAALTKVLSTWQTYGNTGRGVKIGVIDTGLDYTHADFGGAGTTAAYDDALAHDTSSSWRRDLPARGRAKVVGGYDFVGDSYNADDSVPADYQPKPHPDRNPLDCNEHGTHVSGTASGYGVTGAGKTFDSLMLLILVMLVMLIMIVMH